MGRTALKSVEQVQLLTLNNSTFMTPIQVTRTFKCIRSEI